ncbi:MAG: carboxylating nicotinate-nucleotide diphosphorylase [Phycisphaerales bacterium]
MVSRLLDLARDEDLGPGFSDVTSDTFIHPSAILRCAVVARRACVLAGLATVHDLLIRFGCGGVVRVETLAHDGDEIEQGGVVAILEGHARSILRVERTLLNLVGRLSGVASLTREFVRAMGDDTSAQLLDTRKTTPGLRVLEKYAVVCGGGYSHRMGLYDAILVKDNHLASRSLDELVEIWRRCAEAEEQQWRVLARSGVPPEQIEWLAASRFSQLSVEVEVDSLQQLEHVLGLNPGVIQVVLLDNFSLDDLKAAVAMRQRRGSEMLLEASGGINLQNIRAVAQTGVDRISVGALTHSAVSVDFGLDAL